MNKPLRRLLLLPCLLTLAALLQGCLVGRSLYYEEPPSTDELRSTSSVDQSDGGAGGGSGGNGSTSVGTGDARAPSAAPATGETETCTPISTPCAKGGGMEYCITLSAGACTKLVYKHGDKAFVCPTGCGGSDCLPSFYGAYTSCQDAAGACTDLLTCCNAAQPALQTSCIESQKSYVAQPYGDVTCKSVLTSYRSQKLCP